ncbi:Zinc transporter 1 [Linum grandiflorum]
MITYLQPALMIVILILTLWIQTTVSSTKCDAVESNQPSSSDEIERGSRTLIKYKSAAVASIFMAGGLGVCLPWFRKITTTTTSSDDQGHATRGGGVLIGKAFAGGVVLATGFIHVLPEAVEKLGSPCLSKTAPWGKFPFAGFMSMVFCMATLVMESVAVGFNSRVRNDDDENPDHQDDESIGRGKIISQILELGVVFDSTIIGISMGTCKSTKTIKPLMAVLSFHQFFEGVCIGESIYQVSNKLRA